MTFSGRIITAGSLHGDGIRHGFFTRQGGVSTGIYAALNCGLGSQDERAAVVENRARVAAALAVSGAPVLTLHQVHSATALVVDGPFPAGSVPRADALVTRTQGLVVGALAADCTPVLFADPARRIVAAAHAGWRGALAGVIEATIAAMEGLGAVRCNIHAAVGPCIGPGAYEVGPEFRDTFLIADTGYGRFFSEPSGKARPHFDLPGFVAHRLKKAGVGAVEVATACTYENESEFFSYRRSTHRKEPDYGRQISAIVVS
jgi:hypothetical protein